MAKITVEAAAKRLGMDPDSCLKRLQEMGMLVRDQLDQIDQDTFQRVKARLEEEKLRAQADTSRTSQRIGSGLIRRRRVKDAAEELPEEALEEKSAAVAAEAAETELSAGEPPAPASTPIGAGEVAAESEAAIHMGSEAVGSISDEVELQPSDESLEIQSIEDEPRAGEAQAAGVAGSVPADQLAPAGEGGEKGKARERTTHLKPRKLKLHEVTKEPARIISRPTIPVDILKPLVSDKAVPAAVPGKRWEAEKPVSPDALREDKTRGRKGRRVVDFGDRGRKKVEVEQETGFMRSRKPKKKKAGKQTEITMPKALKRKIKITDEIQVGELARRMGIKSGELIKKLMQMGMMVTIVQYIDFDTAAILASEFGFEVENVTVEADDFLVAAASKAEDMLSRPPVVTVMGHVDHGKTTLLDAIRKTDVAGGEAGGITQHIGSYSVHLPEGRYITFVDTPGHESFAAMRARGAHVTDIVVLVVAADDGVMPQTIESINHAKEAKVPIVVAINKVDKENANVGRIQRQLMDYGLVSEVLGGDTLFSEISAKKRIGIDSLLENILLQSEVMELKADPQKAPIAVILDARLERGLGPVADVLVKEGTLHKGDYIVADTFYGRVRMMFDDRGKELTEVLPGLPAEVIGLNGIPRPGMVLNGVPDEKTAKTVANLRHLQARSVEQKKRANIKLEDVYAQIQEGAAKELKLVLKGDVQGSVEAIQDSLAKLKHEEVKVHIIHSGVGAITETDVNFASASGAILIGFNVRPESKVKDLAEHLGVEIKLYTVIYSLIEEITLALEGMLAPTISEVSNGVAEVRETFHISRIGTVAGCYVQEGKILRNSQLRLLRDGVVVYTGKVRDLKRFKDDAREVQAGFECGISIEGFNDIKPGDKIESFNIVENKTLFQSE